jgi:hypothetical protein
MEQASMKQVHLDLIKQQKNDSGIRGILEDHKAIFEYIKKLKDLVDQPENHQYAIGILESFTAYFLEHVIKEEQILQQYLPIKVVADHTLLHQNELNNLDEYLKILKAKLSSQNIKTIAMALDKEFKNHIQRYDNDILKKLSELKL